MVSSKVVVTAAGVCGWLTFTTMAEHCSVSTTPNREVLLGFTSDVVAMRKSY